MQIYPDKGNLICCIVNNTVCLTKSEQNYYWISTRAHFSYKRIRRISCSSRLHKQSLNLCGTVFLSTSLSLSVCVRVFFFCKTSVKIGCFGLAPLASVNCVYLALWCVFRCLIKLLVLNRVLSFPPRDTVAVQILHCALLLSSSFILK